MGRSEKLADRERQRLGASESEASSQVEYRMRLFVAGDEPNSVMARRNIKEICAVNIQGVCTLTVIDVFEDFTTAIEENILVTPALIIDKPKKAKIFGNLQDKQKLLSALDLL